MKLKFSELEELSLLLEEMKSYSDGLRSQSYANATAQEIRWLMADRIDIFKDKLDKIVNR